jgi:hypothetical protein
MSGNVVATAGGDALDRRLERRVLEGLYLPAVVADEVVVMVAASVRRLEARDAVPEIDALDEAQAVQSLERPIHACNPDVTTSTAHAIVDFLGGQAAALLAEELDDEASGGAAPAARLA